MTIYKLFKDLGYERKRFIINIFLFESQDYLPTSLLIFNNDTLHCVSNDMCSSGSIMRQRNQFFLVLLSRYAVIRET